MPSLSSLTDAAPQQDTSLPVEQPYTGANLGPLQASNVGPVGNTDVVVTPAAPSDVVQADPDSVGSTLGKVIDRLTGSNGEERYQLWPEKVIREALAAPHDALTGELPQYSVDPDTGDVHTSPQMIAGAQAVSALAGSGGLAGVGDGAEAALGSTPFLRPALKYGDKIYKAPVNGQHLDALPAHLADTFQKQALSGEDISNFNFGFMNHKGQFLDREKALDYAVKEGLVDPSAGQYGSLTSTLLADSSKPGTAIEAMAKTGSPFYSALEHNINQISQAKMTGDQWLGTLANKPGVKPEEMDWTGVKDFLKERGSQPVTKAELQEHLANNKVELKEVNKGNGKLKEVAEDLQKSIGNNVLIQGEKFYPDEVEMGLYNGGLKPADLPTHLQHKAQALLDAKAVQNDPTKYHSYQLPGGENYREMLMTLPPTKNVLPQFKVINEHGHVESTWAEKSKADAWASKNNYTVREDEPITLNGGYKSSHWDEPNILAHVRMNDRTIDGKKSLHLEEIQSDWHQQGREKGYKVGDEEAGKKIYESIPGKAVEWKNLTQNQRDIFMSNAVASNKGVPDAPFKKTWHELALKRMIREAAEKGYDRLSWTPGEAQAARYDLSKSIGSLKATPIMDQHGLKYEIRATSPNGTQEVLNQVHTADELPNVVGKEMAKKIIDETEGKHPKTFKGLYLKVGGEGMKGFYDQIIPKSLSKISGEKVKTAELPGKLSNKMGQPPETHPVHYIDIPQSLKDKALHKGFPLFSGNYMYTPVSGNPFDKKKKSK